MISDNFKRQLDDIVGREHVAVSRTASELYSYDASLARGKPGIVVFPADGQEVARVVRAARREGISFVPRGFGTNLSGGTIVADEGLIICLSRLNRILGLHPRSRSAVVQPGVTNLELQDATAKLGYFYAPDPASQKVATIGGNLGENSGGPRCLKYGVTSNHVLGMEVVLPDGEILHTGGAALDPPGIDLRGAIVGSEGTFGIITEVTVRILPQTEKVITMLAIYDSIADAATSVSDIISAGILPNTLEMMDATIIKAVEDSYACGYPRDAAAVLIIEVEGPRAGLKEQARRIQQICKQTNCRDIQEAKDEGERNRLWQGRRGAFGAVARLAPNYLVNDATVPRTRLPEALAKVAQISEKYGFEHGNVFHAGDGNLHPLLLFDSRDEDQLRRVEKAGWEIMQACVDLGGTISGEHGIGIEKREAMRMVFSEDDFDVQRALKRAFDPDNVLNPGKIIPPRKTDAKASTPAGDSGNGAVAGIIQEVKRAASRGLAVEPVGSDTYRQYGNSGAENAVRLAASSLADIVDHDPPNQVITVGAGMSFKTLQQKLKQHNQWLPLRPPFFQDSSTVGRLIALAACGPERLLYGAPRDMLLGLRYINSSGQLIAAGGRVVKNVAGYDITRLITGSAGTLGFITEATWRVSTMPERCSAIFAAGALDACAATALDILGSTCLPAFVVCNPAVPSASDPDSGKWNLIIGFEGFSRTVDYQLEMCSEILSNGYLNLQEPLDYDVHDGIIAEAYNQISQSNFILRGDFLLDRVSDFINAFGEVLPSALVSLDFGCGRILAGIDDLRNEQWSHLCELAVKHEGHILLEKAPNDFKKRNDVFGLPSSAWKIMHRIKAELDPHNLFAPGRLPGKV
jgi:glycolate oxidase subunit GlcD